MWKVSCIVPTDEALGVVLAAMNRAKGVDVMMDDNVQPEDGKPLPTNRALAVVPQPTQYRAGSGRAVLDQVITSLAPGARFTPQQIFEAARQRGYNRTTVVGLEPWMSRGLVEREQYGVYKRTRKSA